MKTKKSGGSYQKEQRETRNTVARSAEYDALNVDATQAARENCHWDGGRENRLILSKFSEGGEESGAGG